MLLIKKVNAFIVSLLSVWIVLGCDPADDETGTNSEHLTKVVNETGETSQQSNDVPNDTISDSDLPAIESGLSQLLIQFAIPVHPELTSGYIVGYGEQVFLKKTKNGLYYIDRVPPGTHDVILYSEIVLPGTEATGLQKVGIRLRDIEFSADRLETLDDVNLGQLGSLKGTVKTHSSPENFQPTVLIEGTKLSVNPDAEGAFEILDIPPGKNDLNFRATGYITRVIQGFDVMQGENQLDAAIYLLQDSEKSLEFEILGLENGTTQNNTVSVYIKDFPNVTQIKLNDQDSFDTIGWETFQNYHQFTSESSGDKTLYVQLGDSQGNVIQTFSKNYKIQSFDPNGINISLNNGVSSSSNRLVEATVKVPEGATKVRFGFNANLQLEPWGLVFESKQITFPANGTQEFCLQFADDSDQKSEVICDSIEIDLFKGSLARIFINDDAPTTNSKSVNLKLVPPSNAVGMMISDNPNFLGATWEAISETKNFEFQAEGPQTIYVKYRDADSIQSDAFTDSIIIKNHIPELTISIDQSGPYNEGEPLTFTASGADTDDWDPLTLSCDGCPDNISITETTSRSWQVAWTPNFSSAGAVTLNFTLSDGINSDSETINLTVADKAIGDATENNFSLGTHQGTASSSDGLSLATHDLADRLYPDNRVAWNTPSATIPMENQSLLLHFDDLALGSLAAGATFADSATGATVTHTQSGAGVEIATGFLGNGATKFACGGDTLTIPGSSRFAESFTIAFWLKGDFYSVDGNTVFMSKTGSGNIKPVEFSWTTSYLEFKVTDTDNNTIALNTINRIDDGAWHHIAVTVSNSTGSPHASKLYLNGKLRDSDTNIINDTDAGSNNLVLGQTCGGSLITQLDELAVFSEALSETQIEAIYNVQAGEFVFGTSNIFESRVLDSGKTSHTWNQVVMTPNYPWGKPLPVSKRTETAFLDGNFDMSTNSMYLRFDSPGFATRANNEREDNHATGLNRPYLKTDNAGGLQYEEGIYGEAIVFDGDNDRVEIDNPTGAIVNTGDFSVSFWWKSSEYNPPNNMVLVNMNRDKVGGDDWLGVLDNSLRPHFDNQNGSNDIEAIPINEGTWHHLVFQRKSGFGEMFIDGDLVHRDGNMTKDFTDINWFLCRHYNDSTEYDCEGSMDDYVFSDDIGYTQEQVRDLAIRGFSGIDIQVRACSTDDCNGVSWMGPSGNDSTWFKSKFATGTTDSTFDISSLSLTERYLQYKVKLISKDASVPNGIASFEFIE